jgi:hypothetical protein
MSRCQQIFLVQSYLHYAHLLWRKFHVQVQVRRRSTRAARYRALAALACARGERPDRRLPPAIGQHTRAQGLSQVARLQTYIAVVHLPGCASRLAA